MLKVSSRSALRIEDVVAKVGISASKYYSWKRRLSEPNRHNWKVPKSHWSIPQERQAVIDFARTAQGSGVIHLRDGYRRIAYTGIDLGLFALSPASVYRILSKEGLLNARNSAGGSKGNGFTQPSAVHQYWHTDIKYINFKGTFLFS